MYIICNRDSIPSHVGLIRVNEPCPHICCRYICMRFSESTGYDIIVEKISYATEVFHRLVNSSKIDLQYEWQRNMITLQEEWYRETLMKLKPTSQQRDTLNDVTNNAAKNWERVRSFPFRWNWSGKGVNWDGRWNRLVVYRPPYSRAK